MEESRERIGTRKTGGIQRNEEKNFGGRENLAGGERIGDERNERKSGRTETAIRTENGGKRDDDGIDGNGKTRIGTRGDGGEERRAGGKGGGGPGARGNGDDRERIDREGGENQESRGRCRTVERSFAGKKENTR